MGYNVFERTRSRGGEPELSITPQGRIRINAAGCRILLREKIKAALLMWDPAARKVAIKACLAKDKNAYAVSILHQRTGSISAKTFLNHIGWSAEKHRSVPARWNAEERMFEATLPEQPVKTILIQAPKSAVEAWR